MRYVFGEYTLDTERHELLHGGAPVKLRPKVFQVLAYLLTHRDRMVPKDELLETIWPRIVGEAVLNSCVMAARKAVGDDGRAQAVIKTMHGLGYRFVAPVSDGAPEPEAEVLTEPAEAADGSPLAESPAAAPEAAPVVAPGLAREHKTVTVLACAVGQAEDLAERLGPEAMHEAMQGFFAQARAVMERYEGTIVQWWGDGFLALFGAPVAHEDDARRAVLAALELNEVLDGRDALDYHAAMGLHSGPVVVGAMEDAQALQPYTAPGRTTDIAVRLRAQAAPGTVLVSEDTYRLVETEVEAAEAAAGEDLPPSYRVLGITRRRAGVPRRLHRAAGRFVGRGEELAILRERLARAETGASQVIGISGVAGIGKSRLLDQFRLGLPAGKVAYLKGHCLPYGRTTPYLPLVDLVRALCAIGEADDAADTAEKIRGHLERAGASEETELLLLELLGVPIDRDLIAGLSRPARRARTFEVLRELVFDAAAQRPAVVVIEDLHWIDATSEDWLSGFVARLGEARILLLATYRPDYGPAWLGRASATQLALPPLTAADSADLVRSILSRGRAAREVTEDIVAKADGNPFFLEELTHTLDADAGRPGPASIPDTVQAVLASRIDRLDPAWKQLLQTCSVIGTRVPHAWLRHVTGLDADALDQGLGNLEETEFLVETRALPERTYRFKHALTQEVAYQSLPRGTRAELHARIAAILERHFEPIVAQQPEVLARHHSEAGNAEAAVRYWQRAGRAAYERSSNIEAIGYCSRGLEVLSDSAIEAGRAEKELSLQLTLAPALMAAKGYGAPEVERAGARARYLCEHIGDEQQLFRALVGLWNFYWVRGELGTARDVAGQLLGLAERAEDPGRRLRAHAAMGEILFHTGELEASYRHLQQGIALYEGTERRSFAIQVPQVVCLCYAAWALWHLGRSEQSLVRANEAVVLADELSHPLSLALSLTLKSELHQFRLEVSECREVAEQALALCREQGLPFWEGTAAIILGWAQAMGGRLDTGHETMEYGLKVFADTGARVQRTAWLGMLAEIHLVGDLFGDGLEPVEEALSWVGQTGEQYYHSELHRLKGELLLARDPKDNAHAAADCFDRALEIARHQGAKMRELRAAVSLARLRRDQGRSEDALTLLEAVLSSFDAESDSVDVRSALDLRDSLA